jgi:hypothetical protein
MAIIPVIIVAISAVTEKISAAIILGNTGHGPSNHHPKANQPHQTINSNKRTSISLQPVPKISLQPTIISALLPSDVKSIICWKKGKKSGDILIIKMPSGFLPGGRFDIFVKIVIQS